MNRIEMAKQIIEWEARRDAEGHIRIYELPRNDGGGAEEYAGLNSRYDPDVLRKIKALISDGKHTEAEDYAAHYIAENTDVAASWLTWSASPAAIEFFLRDTVFNRGAGGASKVLQMAVGAGVDGKVGPATRARLAEFENRPLLLLARLRGARERYEREIVGVRENFWQGLVNRFDKAFEASVSILA